MSNPLLNLTKFPLFSKIHPNNINPAIDEILARNRAKLAEISSSESKSWDSIAEIEDLTDTLDRSWSQVSHLNSVVNSSELRAEYELAEQKITEYYTEFSHNEDLFKIYTIVNKQLIDKSPEKKLLDDAIRDFHLSGITLNKAEQEIYTKLVKEICELETKFSNNILDCTDAWSLEVNNESEVEGIPDYILSFAKKNDTYIFDLKAPTYIAIMQYAKNRDLRQKFYEAYVTRASDAGSHDKKYDNSAVMFKILQKKSELAQLLGFDNYAEKSLATKMAGSAIDVRNFLNNLVKAAHAKANQEFLELTKFSELDKLEPWDIAYYSEKMRLKNFNISDEVLREYFPLEKVQNGLFLIIEKLYNIKINIRENSEVWHSDVQFFEIIDKSNNEIGYFYFDLFARDKKRGGAWMDECQVRKKLFPDQEQQLPIAYLTCNFTPPDKSGLALLTHDEVITLFHEFGHGLHHLLTKINYPSISGINGVPWDGVELPSQFLENWCWQKESLELISEHYQTKEFIPDELFEKMLAAKNFQQAMAVIRQLEFALFDFLLHENFQDNKGPEQIQNILDDVRAKVSVVPKADYNRFQHSFSHIFSGGYAAGYYSYLWAEVLAADAFSKFLEEGIFNPKTAQSFLHNILEKGGSEEFLELFIKFRGRGPDVGALLKERGIA